jgi:hypothetical protein
MAEEKKPEQPKIVIDEVWKAQAEAEKQRLAEQEEHPSEGGPGGPRELPPANFATLVSSMVTQILFALGGIQDPQTGRRYLDLPLAKHHIDTLSMLEEKTKGNLSEEEKKLLDQALYEVRMLFVRMAQGGIGS